MTNTKQIRAEVKSIIIENGINNVLNCHLADVAKKCNCSICDTQNALRYFMYSPQQANFRATHS